MYDIKSYINATSIEAAVNALAANPNATIIAGGSDVLIRIRDGKKPQAELVCIRNIPELVGITETAVGLRIGPATPFSKVAANELVKKYIPILAEGVSQVGGPQVRNVGTVGGNVSNGATSGDSAPSLFALNAKLELVAPTPIRSRKAEALAIGQEYSAELIAKIADIAVTEGKPRTSWRASREFRLQLIHELVTRAVAEAVRRAGGKI